MLTLLMIVAANLASTVVSLSLAALLGFRWLSGLVDRLVHVSIGLLLATALVHIVPEALDGGIAPPALGWTVLLGILGMFVLEKLTLIHHTHHHEGDGHDHGHGHDAHEVGRGAYPILIADALHNFAGRRRDRRRVPGRCACGTLPISGVGVLPSSLARGERATSCVLRQGRRRT